MVPARGVEDLAREVVDALDVGELGFGERAGAGDHEVGGDVAAVVMTRQRAVLVPDGPDGDLEPEPVEDPGSLGGALDVGLDLGLRENERDQSGWARTKEYSWEGTSQAAPG